MFNGLGNFLGNVYHGAANAIGNALHPQPQKPSPVYNLPGFLAQHLGQATVNVAKPVARVVNRDVVKPVVHIAQPVLNIANNTFNPLAPVPTAMRKGALNFVKGATVDTPITIGRAANQVINSGQQQKDYTNASNAANTQEDQAWKAYRAGKISGQRASALINDAYNQRNQSSNLLQNQIHAAPTGTDATMALGGLGLAAVGGTALKGGSQAAKSALETGAGLYFGGNAIKQVPGEVKAISHLKGNDRIQAATEAILNTATGVAGGAAALHGGYGLAKEGVKAYQADPLVNNQHGFIGGASATDFNKAEAKGKTFIGVDGKPRFEFSDKGAKVLDTGVAKLQQGQTTPLREVLKHPELEKQYPTFFGDGEGVKVKLDSTPNAKAVFDPKTNTISVNPNVIKNLNSDLGKKTLIHELTHAKQVYEGHATGTTPEAIVNATKSPEQIKTENYLKTYTEPYKALESNYKQGLITKDQFHGDPLVDNYRVAQERLKRMTTGQPVDNGFAAYKANAGEQEAELAASRANLSNRQLRKNPIEQTGARVDFQPQPAGSTDLMANAENPGIKPNQFTKHVQTSPEVSTEVQKGVAGQHEVRSTQLLAQGAGQFIKEHGLADATQAIHDALAVPDGQITDTHVANAIAVAKANDLAGNLDHATAIYDALSNHLVKAGQTVQAASLLASRTPEGLAMSAIRQIKKAGVSLTPELQAKIGAATEAIRSTPEGSPERFLAVQKLDQITSKAVPSSLKNKGIGLWKGGLLSGLKTVAKIGTSYAIDAPIQGAAKLVGAAVDAPLSLITGKRALTSTTKGIGSGIERGLGAARTKLITNLDEMNSGGFGSHSTNYNHKLTQAYVDFASHTHGAVSKPLFTTVFDNAIADQAKAAAINQGVKGVERTKFINEFISDPTDKAVQHATDEAKFAVNQQETAGGKLASKLQQHGLIGQILAPFTRVPAAIGTKGLIDYTALGIPSEVIKQVRAGTFNQRGLDLAIGRATVGTGVGVGLGALLMEKGLITGSAPTDKKERALWDLQGKKPNSIKVGGHWLSVNALGSIGITLELGAAYKQGLQDNNGDMAKAASVAFAQGGKTLLDQPYLKGVSGMANALNDPTRYAQTFVDNTVGSVIPTISSEAAQSLDPTSRQVAGVTDALKNKLPGLRTSLPARLDIYGNNLPSEGGIGAFVDPFNASKATSGNTITQELQRLNTVNNGGGVAQADKNFTVNGLKTRLDPIALNNFIQKTGTQIQQQLTNIIQSPSYQNLSDGQKQNVIDAAVTAIREAGQTSVLGDKIPTDSAGKIALSGGQLTASSTKDGKGTVNNASSVDPKLRYQAAKQTFDQNIKDGKLNSVQQLKAQQSLDKLKITSQFPDAVVQFYGLSGAQKNAMFKADPATAQDLYNQAKQLAQALGDTNKLKAPRVSRPRVARLTKVKPLSIKPFKLAKAPKLPTVKVRKAPRAKITKVPKTSKKLTLIG